MRLVFGLLSGAGGILINLVIGGLVIALLVSLFGAGPILLVGITFVALIIGIVVFAANQNSPGNSTSSQNSPEAADGLEAWSGLSAGHRRDIVDQTLYAVYGTGIKSLSKIRPLEEYVAGVEAAYQAHKATSKAPFRLCDAILDIVKQDHADQPEVVSAMTSLHGSAKLPNNSICPVRAEDIPHLEAGGKPVELVNITPDLHEVIRVTTEMVFAMGAQWMPKTRSPQEYLREVERRWKAEALTSRGPVQLSHAILDIIRDDCAGHPKVMLAIDRARSAGVPKDAILFQEAGAGAPT